MKFGIFNCKHQTGWVAPSILLCLGMFIGCGEVEKRKVLSIVPPLKVSTAQTKIKGAYWAKALGERRPIVLFLPGTKNKEARQDFQVVVSELVSRGYGVITPEVEGGGVSPTIPVTQRWKERVKQIARSLKQIRKRKSVNLRKMVIIAAEDDRWLAAYLATRLKSAVHLLVLLGAPSSSLLDALLERKTGIPGRRGREKEVLALKKSAYAATKVHPFCGATAQWWKKRFERHISVDLCKLRIPVCIIHGKLDDQAPRRVEFLKRYLKIAGDVPFVSISIEGLDENWRDSQGSRNLTAVIREAFPILWKHCGVLTLFRG